jgi:pyruvate formate lyase activating enzyme
MEACYYEKREDGIHCLLCPHYCIVREDKTGICKVRRNTGGKLVADTYGRLSSIQFDPIEKKPLYHYHPGKIILSLGSVGCNMKCQCCQNWQISQTGAINYPFAETPELSGLIGMALSKKQNIGVAYTYNEPTVWFEYMIDIARLAHASGLKNVMVSNGYIAREPLQELFQYLDAFNIDLKAFSQEFYKKYTGSELLPVLNTLKQIKAAGKHLEITFLVIPTLNDNFGLFGEMTDWICGELGRETILHLSRYHPTFKLSIEPTSSSVLEQMHHIAKEKLDYVYIGNLYLKNYQDTLCPCCGTVVISRNGYTTSILSITPDGLCSHCGKRILQQE